MNELFHVIIIYPMEDIILVSYRGSNDLKQSYPPVWNLYMNFASIGLQHVCGLLTGTSYSCPKWLGT